ncbi:hypothetical protein EXE58_05855 [Nocardioides seonyuensis]|uniref:Uncharacterized protein n=1 Tax=Nocardioides seonyuensis TaxID=2518371 RepID=A0A4P7IEN7_9ACTN|nr:hypothetical protein [Nocardioides seonyuensis]QBX55023.1 hypothetical protein EXE58_05855 [Nocardioides seonyuensis]
MTPTWGEAVPLSAGRGTVYRLDGRVVAASSGDDLVPTALSGSHAVTLDIFALIALLGFSSVFFLAVRRSRSAGARWSDEIAPLTQGWGFASAASFVGSVGALTTFTLGVGVVPWVVMGVVWGAVLLYAVHLRQMRRRRGVGGHAAW